MYVSSIDVGQTQSHAYSGRVGTARGLWRTYGMLISLFPPPAADEGTGQG